MTHMFSFRFAPAMTAALVLALAPVPGFVNDAFAGSKSRSATRAVTAESETEVAQSRGKSRRATRGDVATDDSGEIRSAGKRSRRRPAEAVAAATPPADAPAADPMILATDQGLLNDHIQRISFSDLSGALALYQLVGKASASLPLSRIETVAFEKLTDSKPLVVLVSDAETRLSDSFDPSADSETMLNAVAAVLGVPRPESGGGAVTANVGS